MKQILALLILISFMALGSCSKNNSDRDVREGSYETFAPVSIDSVPIHDVWEITENTFKIRRDGVVIYSSKIQWYGNRMELFSGGENPYYNEDFSGGTITTVSWGFWFYPKSGKTFQLQKL